MANGDTNNPLNKGKAFFDRGDQVAETGNWDFAIQMYLDGIHREPTNVERGHRKLREVSLKRKASGGKSAGLLESLTKGKGGKDPVDGLVNAEYLLAKDPGNVSHMLSVLKALEKIGDKACTKWITDILFDAERQAKKPSKRMLATIAEAYGGAEEYQLATQACDMGLRLDPSDGHLADIAKNYSARAVIKQGQYDGTGSFTHSVKDLDKQIELNQTDQLAQSGDAIQKTIERARKEYEAEPEIPGKIDTYVDALLKIEQDKYESLAMEILTKAYTGSKAFRYKVKLDDIRIRLFRRKFNELRTAGKKEAAIQVAREQLAFELKSYKERVVQYPTDLGLKFELGRRQFTAGQLDEAIASLQQAQRDPKRRVQSLTMLGQAFAKMGWHQQASETYERALENDPSEERGKEIRYNLAVSLKAMGEKQKALDHFSEVAQLDFTFKDVRTQIEELRKEMSGGA